MQQFLKYTFASVIGCLIASLALLFVAATVIAGIALSGDTSAVTLTGNSVLHVKLEGEISEIDDVYPLQSVLGPAVVSQRLSDIVDAIDLAADLPQIRAIYVECGLLSANTAALEEIRNALQRAQAKKKTVITYGKQYSQGAYYVCSVANEIGIHPQGSIDLHGLAAQSVYYKDLMAKFGVKATVLKVGKYKSFTERYTEQEMSDANREQTSRYINQLWNTIAGDIAKSRGIPLADVNECADSLSALHDMAFLQRHKLVGFTSYANDIDDNIKAKAGIDKDEELQKVTCKELIASQPTTPSSDDIIAIYHLEGSIVSTAENGLAMGDAGIVSPKVIKDLKELQDDDAVKAVVLRINSGGGEAFAAEEIWYAVQKLKEKKPVVVSMGGSAASGAYYLSVAATRIVAQPTTLTGSIGIFGVLPNVHSLMTDKLGLHFDGVKTNAHSDFDLSQSAREMDATELHLLQQYINNGYELFVKRVADGRHKTVAGDKAKAQDRDG